MTDNSFNIGFNKRFSGNLTSNFIYFFLNIIIGLALVPFFIDTLGNSAYGLIPLATSITHYITIVIDSLNQSVSRYLTIDLQKGDYNSANKTFNTAVFGTVGLILLLVPIALIVAWYAPNFFNIGEQSATDVSLLFALVMGSVLVRAWSSNFMVPLFAHNRLDLRNLVNITYLITQLTVVILLFIWIGPSLPLVGLSYFIASIVTLIMAYVLSKKICPSLYLSIKLYSKEKLGKILGMGGWLIISMIGILLRAQIALMVVNILFGDVAGTEFSLVIMWMSLLSNIGDQFTNVFTPAIFSYYSKGDNIGLLSFTKLTIRITGLIMALLIGLVCIFAPQLMTLWIGEGYANLTPLIWIMIIPLMVRSPSTCVSPISTAYGKVRIPAIANLCVGGLNLILALSLPFILNNGMYGVAYACAISTILMTGIIHPVYSAYLLKIPLLTFIKPVGTGLVAMLILWLIGTMVTSIFTIDSLLLVVVAGGIISVIYMIIILKGILDQNERDVIRSCLPSAIKNKIPSWIL